MPPHSKCQYSNTAAANPWSHVTGGLFCGSSIPPSPADDEEGEAASTTDLDERVPQFPPAPRYPGGTKRYHTNPRSPRNVSFETEVEIYEIPSVKEFPKSQLADMYMTKEEMAAIHAEAWEIVELMNLGIEYAEGNSFSKRGLVDLVEDNVERRKRTREHAYKVVFGMQSMHGGGRNNNARRSPDNKPSYSPQIMADLYQQVSIHSKNLAHRAALYDAVAAGQAQY